MQRESIWRELQRFGVEALCLMMLLYGPPLRALQEMAPPPSSQADVIEDDGLWGTLAEGVGSTVEVLESTLSSGVDRAEALAGQPWTDALAILLATGAGEDPPVELLTDAVGDAPRLDDVPPLPPGFGESPRAAATRRAGTPGVGASPEALLASRNHLDSIPLLAGWNLLSIPEEPADPSPGAVLAPIVGNVDRVFAYDACDPVDPWKLYDPADAAASDLLDLDPTKGFWVEATGATSLPSSGTLAPTTSWQLCTGWNLIGYPAGEPRHIRNALQSIEGKYSRVFGFDPADVADSWEIWDAGVPDWANDLVFLRPGFGYWVLATEDVTLEIANEAGEPTVEITAPADLGEITAPTEIRGTVQSPILDHWDLSYRLVGEPEWIELATGSFPLTDAPLATFDPTLLLNGLYEVRLEATDLSGAVIEETIAISVDGQMKIGPFSLSFLDLAIPLSGLDIEVIRNYDSRDKRVGDFGVGWTLELRQGSYTNNRPPGEGWQLAEGFLPCDTVLESKSHLTQVRLSEFEIYYFRLQLDSGAPTLGGCFAQASFDFVDGPVPGATLEILGSTEVFYAHGADQVVVPSTQEAYVPDNVRLTTRDGRIFDLSLETGVTRLEDPNGNTLAIAPQGITHSSGRGIDFQRDGDGRIVEITDPMGEKILYDYDAAGDLVAVTDRVGSVTRFTYQADHFLAEIENALGVPAVRSEYDDEGRLVRTIDAAGQVTEFGHDVDQRREVVTDSLGFSRILTYDDRGNIVEEIDAYGNVTRRTFDARDNVLSETDALDQTTSFEYTPAGDLSKRTDPLGHKTEMGYDPSGRVTSFKDPLGNTTTSAYDTRGNLTRRTDAAGETLDFVYEPGGEVGQLTDALGVTTHYDFDGFGNLTQETDAGGSVIAYTYDANGNRKTESRTRTLADGTVETQVTRYTYDAMDRLLSTEAPDGTVRGTTYNALGRISSETDELGRTTSYSFGPTQRLTGITFPDGTSETRTYDPRGRLASVNDRAGRVTSFTFDAMDNPLTVTLPDGSTIRQIYDAMNQVVTASDPADNLTTFEVDAGGRRTKIVDPLGNEQRFAYDAAGRLVSTTDANGNTTSHTYDVVGRMVGTTYPDGSTVGLAYDAQGRLLSRTDALGRVTEYTYDSLHRLTQVTDALDQVTAYGYDEMGNLVSQTDVAGRVTRFEYDSRSRRTAKIFPDGQRETWTFNSDGTVASHTAAGGGTTTFDYDSNGRLVTRTRADGSTTQVTYTASGRRATLTDGRGTTQYVYDARDRLTRKTEPNGWHLHYGYDAVGNRTSLTAEVGASSRTATFGFDAANRLQTVTDPQGGVTSYTYDGNGNPTVWSLPNGLSTEVTYDARNRPVDLVTRGTAGEILERFSYTLGASGRRDQIDEHDGTSRQYAFDALDSLTQDRVVDPAGGVVYQSDFTYDPLGNRQQLQTTDATGTTSLDYTYDTRDRLLNDGAGTTLAWDARGRLVSESTGTSYLWDSEDRLVGVDLADGTEVRTVYDADGNRVRREETAPGETAEVTNYLVDTSGPLSQVVADVDASGEITNFYLRGLGLLGVQRANAGDDRYYHLDALGSVRMLSDSSGSVTDRYSYQAFGALLDHQGSDPNPYRFAGEPFDLAAGLSYNRARWLDPGTGRFVSVDPFRGFLQDPRSSHKYLYAHQNPVDMTDPSGLISGLAIAAIAIVVLAAFFFFTPPINQGIKPIRTLTSGERALADTAFRGVVDYDKVRVINSKLFRAHRAGYAITPRNSIYFNPNDPPGSAYSADFSRESLHRMAWLVHELTHVWQHQSGRFVPSAIFYPVYDYLPLRSWKSFDDYGLEQQGSIVEDFFLLVNGQSLSGRPPICVYYNVIPWIPPFCHYPFNLGTG